MTIEICDICGQPMVDVFTDENGKMWGSVSFREKKYRVKKCFFGDSWTEYLSICGRCRAELAKRHRKE